MMSNELEKPPVIPGNEEEEDEDDFDVSSALETACLLKRFDENHWPDFPEIWNHAIENYEEGYPSLMDRIVVFFYYIPSYIKLRRYHKELMLFKEGWDNAVDARHEWVKDMNDDHNMYG